MSTIKVNAIESTSSGGVAAKIASVNGGPIGVKNLVINGDFRIAQRATSSTDPNYATVDRFLNGRNGLDEAPTQAQHVLTSSDTPYAEGFRFSYHITNGNQTSAGADDALTILHAIEAQDIASSGWNYTSSSSYVTLQFWVKSSVAQNFYFLLRNTHGTPQRYAMETGTLSANTWTKITKTISGNSNLVFANSSVRGLVIEWSMFRGTNKTNNSVSLNAWSAMDATASTPDFTSTWYTTNDATFEITGVQLEVGDVATEFERRSFGQEFALCQRYCQVITMQNGDYAGFIGIAQGGSDAAVMKTFPVSFRDEPTYTGSATSMRMQAGNVSNTVNFNALSIYRVPTQRPVATIGLRDSNIGSMTAGQVLLLQAQANNGKMIFDAEI